MVMKRGEADGVMLSKPRWGGAGSITWVSGCWPGLLGEKEASARSMDWDLVTRRVVVGVILGKCRWGGRSSYLGFRILAQLLEGWELYSPNFLVVSKDHI